MTESETMSEILMVQCCCAADVGIGSLGKKNTTYAVRSYHSCVTTCDFVGVSSFPHTVILSSRSAARQHVHVLTMLQHSRA